MKNSVLLLLFSGILAKSSLTAVAYTFPLYVGVGYGNANYTGDAINDPVFLPGQQADDSTQYYEAYVGWRFTDLLAAELSLAQFGDIEERYRLDPDIAFVVTPNDQERVDFSRVTLMGVFEYPVILDFSVFAMGGYAYYDVERVLFGGFDPSGNADQLIGETEHGLEYGFGAKYYFFDRFSARAQWQTSLIEDKEVDSVRLSVEFQF